MSQPSSPARTPRIYASVAEMKRSKGKVSLHSSKLLPELVTGGTSDLLEINQGTSFCHNHFQATGRVRFSTAGVAIDGEPIPGDLHRDFHSTPDLTASITIGRQMAGVVVNEAAPARAHRSQEELRPPLPPPTHPPPPPPSSGPQIIPVEVGDQCRQGGLNKDQPNGMHIFVEVL